MKSKKVKKDKAVLTSKERMVKEAEKPEKLKGKAVKIPEPEVLKSTKVSKVKSAKESKPVKLKSKVEDAAEPIKKRKGENKKADELKPPKQKKRIIKLKDQVKINLREKMRENLKGRRRRRPPVIPAAVMEMIQGKRTRKKRTKGINPLVIDDAQTKVIVNKKAPAGKSDVGTIVVSKDNTGIETAKGKYKTISIDGQKPASIGWKYFLDKQGFPLMKLYTENPAVFFKLEKIGDIKKSARYYTHKGDMVGADFIIPYSMIETACTIAGIKTPKNLVVIQPVEQHVA